MINVTNATAALALGLALIAASPAMAAKSRAAHPGHDARAQSVESVIPGDGSMTAARERALRECNDKVSGLKQYTWGLQQSYALSACMSEHGQPD